MRKMIEMLADEGIEMFITVDTIIIGFIKWDEFKEEFPDLAAVLTNGNWEEDNDVVIFYKKNYRVFIGK